MNKYIDQTVLDHETFNLLKDFFLDEKGDKAWTEQQIELIDHLGIKNYLLSHLLGVRYDYSSSIKML